ncbi:MAG: hypothetical protein R3F11_00165 [Verrucomicrobiales bacterium]
MSSREAPFCAAGWPTAAAGACACAGGFGAGRGAAVTATGRGAFCGERAADRDFGAGILAGRRQATERCGWCCRWAMASRAPVSHWRRISI